MPRAGPQLRKFVILCHRWLGTAFCLLFVSWFLSGMVLMYWDYPQVDARERLARAAPLDPHSIRVSPAQAYAALGGGQTPDEVRSRCWMAGPYIGSGSAALSRSFMRMLQTRRSAGGDPSEYGATDRIRMDGTTERATPYFREKLTRADQWTVSGEFRALRPLFKFSWPNGD